MDLRCRFDQILKMGTGEEVSEVDEFAVVLILNVDDSPSVLASTHLLASNNDRLLRSNNSKGDDVLNTILVESMQCSCTTYLDLGIQSSLLLIELIVIVREHLQVVESKLLLYALLECASLFKGQGIGLGNDWDDIDNI